MAQFVLLFTLVESSDDTWHEMSDDTLNFRVMTY